jgi:hypothetical protein
MALPLPSGQQALWKHYCEKRTRKKPHSGSYQPSPFCLLGRLVCYLSHLRRHLTIFAAHTQPELDAPSVIAHPRRCRSILLHFLNAQTGERYSLISETMSVTYTMQRQGHASRKYKTSSRYQLQGCETPLSNCSSGFRALRRFIYTFYLLCFPLFIVVDII